VAQKLTLICKLSLHHKFAPYHRWTAKVVLTPCRWL